MCFEFGIELEEDTTAKELAASELGAAHASDITEDRSMLKIDIPANRFVVQLVLFVNKDIQIRSFVSRRNSESVDDFYGEN